MVSKNQFYEAAIEGMTLEGSGVARVDGFAVFIPLAAPGDFVRFKVVKVLKRYAFGLLDRVLTPSPDRLPEAEQGCPVYRRCGGCAFRHIRYEAERRLKEEAVRDAFRRLGGFELDPLPILAAPETDRYRNKAQYPLGIGPDGRVAAGFYARNSHRIIPAADCPLQPVIFSEIIRFVTDFLTQNRLPVYDEQSGTGVYRHIYLREAPGTGEVMLCLVAACPDPPKAKELAARVRERFPAVVSIWLNVNPARTNVILGERYDLLSGKEQITDLFLGKRLSISPASFYQVNQPQAERLYQLAFDFAGFDGSEHLLDLYCGIGSIGLSAADRISRLTGVEIVPQAVENACFNAAQNGVPRAEFFCADASAAAKRLAAEGARPDVVIVDPPRKGCGREVIEAIFEMGPGRVVMISCNPATAARDCALLAGGGYRLEKYQPVDLFPRTGHVETVVLLSKLNTKQHIEVELNLDELDLTSAESKATYDEIKAYVLEKHGLKVSSLYISQVKRKCGLDVGQNYNLSKKEDAKVPQCPPEKEAAIMAALKHFRMI